MVMGENEIDDNNKKRWQFHLPCRAVVQCGVHRPMEHILGFTRSHRMLPLGECLHWITAVGAMMVEDFGQKHKTLTKKYF